MKQARPGVTQLGTPGPGGRICYLGEDNKKGRGREQLTDHGSGLEKPARESRWPLKTRGGTVDDDGWGARRTRTGSRASGGTWLCIWQLLRFRYDMQPAPIRSANQKIIKFADRHHHQRHLSPTKMAQLDRKEFPPC